MKAVPVKVIWHDACGGKTGWLDPEEARRYTPTVIESYGWLLRKDKDVLVIAMSRDLRKSGRVNYADTLDVPRAMVKSVTKLPQ